MGKGSVILYIIHMHEVCIITCIMIAVCSSDSLAYFNKAPNFCYIQSYSTYVIKARAETLDL